MKSLILIERSHCQSHDTVAPANMAKVAWILPNDRPPASWAGHMPVAEQHEFVHHTVEPWLVSSLNNVHCKACPEQYERLS